MRVLAISAAVAAALGVADAALCTARDGCFFMGTGATIGATAITTAATEQGFCGGKPYDTTVSTNELFYTRKKVPVQNTDAVTAGEVLLDKVSGFTAASMNQGKAASIAFTAKFTRGAGKVPSAAATAAQGDAMQTFTRLGDKYYFVSMVDNGDATELAFIVSESDGTSTSVAEIGCGQAAADGDDFVLKTSAAATDVAWYHANKDNCMSIHADKIPLYMSSNGVDTLAIIGFDVKGHQFKKGSATTKWYYYNTAAAGAATGKNGGATGNSVKYSSTNTNKCIQVKGTTSSGFAVNDCGEDSVRKQPVASAATAHETKNTKIIGNDESATTANSDWTTTAGDSTVSTTDYKPTMAMAIAVSADGKTLVIADRTGTAKQWKIVQCTSTTALAAPTLCKAVGTETKTGTVTDTAHQDVGFYDGNTNIRRRSFVIAVFGTEDLKADVWTSYQSMTESIEPTPVPPPPPTTTMMPTAATPGTPGTPGTTPTTNATTNATTTTTSASAPLVASAWALVGAVAALIAA